MTDDKEKDANETETIAPEEPQPEETTATATEEADESHEAPEGDEEEVVFVEEPLFDIQDKGDCVYEVKVSIPPANRKKQSDEMFDELSHDVQVPGFRKGKAPRRLIERKFSKAVRSEVDAKLVSAAFKKLIKDKDLHPISNPDVDGLEEVKERSEEEPLDFTLKFEVSPKVELGKYRGLEVERPIVSVDEKDIDEVVEEQRNRYAVYETVTDGAAQEGDQAIIDFKGTIDGEEFAGGAAEAYPYILGTKRFFPEFETALAGASTGEQREVDVTFPDSYHAENLRGKTAHFTIKINEIKRRQAPELTDDFAKQAGYEGVDDMRQKIRERMQVGANSQSDQYAESNALNAVIESSTFQIPKSLIESTVEAHYEDDVRRLLSMRIPMAEIREREQEMREHAREHAIEEIKSIVVLNEIAEAEGIEITDEDYEQEVASLATRAGVESTAAAQYIEESGRRGSYEGRILRAKALKVIMDNAQITDKEVAHEEQEAASDPEQDKE